MWKCGYRIFIVFMNFNAPDSTLMTFDVNQFMHRTNFVKFEFRWNWKLKSQITFMVTLVHRDRKRDITCFFGEFFSVVFLA